MLQSIDFKTKLRLAFALIVMIMLLLKLDINDYIKLFLFACAYVAVAYETVISAFKTLFKRFRMSEQFLMSIATFGAIALGDYPEALAVLIFYEIGELFEEYASGRSHKEITSLIALKPQIVRVIDENGNELKVKPRKVKIGQTIRVLAGEAIALDGVLKQGSAAVDLSALTGESEPYSYKEGEEIPSGGINMGSVIELVVTKDNSNSSITRLIELIEDAAANKSKPEALISRFAVYYTPIVVTCAVLLALVPFFIEGESFSDWIERALVFLVVSCPCALVLSVPLSFFGGLGAISKIGVMVKGSIHIETLSKLTVLALDKTGTITRGRPSITKITCNDGFDETTVLKLAAATEVHSTHPMALAILDAVKERKLEIPRHLDTKTIIARGIEGDICPFEGCPGGKTYVGSLTLMHEMGIQDLELAVEKQSPVGSLIYVAFAGVLAGVIEVSDPIRDQFKRSVNRLRHLGVEEIVMLTGDNESAAASIAQSLALDDYKAQVLPEDKAKYVANRQGNCNVLMVGDGINDAPALAYADIGVAMGTGCTDTALETADVTINSEDPLKLPEFISISRDTMHLVHQNFAVTILVNTAAMMLGALGVINPLVASVIHNASTLGVVVNSGRVLVSHKKNA